MPHESCNEQKAQRLEKSCERQNGAPPIRARIDWKPCVLNRPRGDTVTALGSRKVNRTDRSTGQRRTNRYTKIGGQFSWHLIDTLRSPAWRALSLSARRILDRLEIEMADHGGTDNGKLPATYDDFERYGLHRHAIAPAIREAVALGFLEITQLGRAGNAEWRRPNLFRLTYRHTDNDGPTNEWEKIETDGQAEALARTARLTGLQKTKSQWRKMPNVSVGKHHRKGKIHSTETATTSHSAETITTLDISGREAQRADRRDALSRSRLVSTYLAAWSGAPLVISVRHLFQLSGARPGKQAVCAYLAAWHEIKDLRLATEAA